MREILHITSHSNPHIKRIKSLSLKKHRDAEGVFIAEGLRHTLEALNAGWELDLLIVEKKDSEQPAVKGLIERCLRDNHKVISVTAEIMQKLARRENAQTVLAILKQHWPPLNQLKLDNGLWIALEEIRDPGNLGTIMRTADAVGASGIILVGQTCDAFSPESIRASMGSFARLALSRCSQDEFLKFSPTSKAQLVGTHLRTDKDYRTTPYRRPLILLMGNEQAGLSDALTNACTDLVKIPMTGHADSLNVSIACGVMLFEICRDRLKI